MENLDKAARFEDAINRAVDSEINAMLDAAREKAAKAVASADEEFLEEGYQFVSGETKRIKSGIDREVSRKSFEASKEVFAYRNKCVEEFFSNAAEEIICFTKTDAYKTSLKDILLKIHGEKPIEDRCVIYVKASDVEEVKRLYPKISVQADKNIKLGGVSVFYPSDSVYIDKTYDNSFEQQKAEFVKNAFMQIQ